MFCPNSKDTAFALPGSRPDRASMRQPRGLWQDLPGSVLYTLITLMYVRLSVRYRVFPWELVHTNPGLPQGGLQIASKFQLHEPLRGRPGFLNQWEIPCPTTAEVSETLLKHHGLHFPLILKPDQGSSGIGVRKVGTLSDLQSALKNVSGPHILQEFSGHSEEFGLFYLRRPGESKGRAISLTHKQIPTVTGDGRHTIRELALANPDFTAAEKQKMLKSCESPDSIPPKGTSVKVILQGSHARGARFVDCSSALGPRIDAWLDETVGTIPGFHFGRLDVKASSLESLREGKTIHLIELNGAMSEPIHVYDDHCTFREGMRTFFQYNDLAFSIAATNKARLPRSERFVNPWKVACAFHQFFRHRSQQQRQY